ncbi:MAG TPA: helix-turn-helix domain-containing protein [Candidatus Krumholzibacteria bacterium]|jgi:transcriptional regulator with XRE-family HTH domain
MSITSDLGRRIKELRQKKNLTLKEIEARVDVSATHVSEIERGKTTPTVGALSKIAMALDVEPSYFLAADTTLQAELRRPKERSHIDFTDDGFSVAPLSASVRGQDLSAGLVCWKVNCQNGGRHLREGEHFALILEGGITLDVGGQRHELAAGDSFHFRAGLEPRITNDGSRDCLALWATSPRFGF